MNEIFARPMFVYLGVAVITGLTFLWPWAEERRRNALAQFAELDLVEPLLPPNAARLRRLRNWLRLACLFFLFLAAAGPRWGVETVEGEEFGIHVVLAVDVSSSMQSQDVKPNRLEKAKRALISLIESLPGNRVGIVAFSGMAAVQCPLTTDLNAARLFLNAMRVDMLPVKGTNVGDSIRLATKMLAPYPGVKGIVLFTDGEDHQSDPQGAARLAAASGIRIFTLGIGSPEGEPIPIFDGTRVTGYKRDEKNQIVLSKLDERGLSEISRLTGGAYYRATSSELEINEIVSHLNNLDRSRLSSGIKERLRDRTQFPLAIAFALLLLELLLPLRFRRGSASRPSETGNGEDPSPRLSRRGREARGEEMPLAILLIICLATLSHAAPIDSEIRKGNRALDEKDFEPALEHYQKAEEAAPDDARPLYNEGIALYRLGKYKESAEKFHKAAELSEDPGLKRAAHYNEGNAKFRAEKPDEAVQNYRDLIVEDATDPITRHNLQIALKRQQMQEKQQKKDKKNDKKDDKKDDKDDQSDSQQKSQQQQSKPPQGGMSKEDAERILQSQSEKEKSNADPNQYNRAGKQKPTSGGKAEDW